MQVQVEELLPPGFRFFPTEEELISFYLHNKLRHTRPDIHRVIPVVDIYDFEPEELPELSGELCRGDPEQWFFFVPRQEREARGGRPSRTTESGYWKATGSPSYVYSSDDRVIGVKKTLVFYKGRAPLGSKTKWKMNEYRSIIDEQILQVASSATAIPKLRLEYCLCRMYVISGTFRGFDRRPPAANTGDAYFVQQPQGDDDEVATSSQKVPAVEVTSPADNSNSFGNCPNFPEVAASGDGWDMVHCKETLWELEDWLQDA